MLNFINETGCIFAKICNLDCFHCLPLLLMYTQMYAKEGVWSRSQQLMYVDHPAPCSVKPRDKSAFRRFGNAAKSPK
jgi:hypothetical protein